MFRIGDKVVFTGGETIESSDYGVVIDFYYHNDGSTSPIVRFNGDDFDSYPVHQYLEIISSSHFEKHIRIANEIQSELEQQELYEQTLMFWNLQLQFMSMDQHDLRVIMDFYMETKIYVRNNYSKRVRRLLNTLVWTEDDHNCVATHLALQLSGLGDV